MKNTASSPFKNKILAIRLYKSAKKEFYETDFTDFKILKEVLCEVDTGESDITPAGIAFLDYHYRFEALAELLSKQNVFSLYGKQNTPDDFLQWLKSLEPMAGLELIGLAQGNSKPGTTLKDQLLPPLDL